MQSDHRNSLLMWYSASLLLLLLSQQSFRSLFVSEQQIHLILFVDLKLLEFDLLWFHEDFLEHQFALQNSFIWHTLVRSQFLLNCVRHNSCSLLHHSLF